jgi:hypothetical protein
MRTHSRPPDRWWSGGEGMNVHDKYRIGFVIYIAWIPGVLGKMGRKLIGASMVIVVMAH